MKQYGAVSAPFKKCWIFCFFVCFFIAVEIGVYKRLERGTRSPFLPFFPPYYFFFFSLVEKLIPGVQCQSSFI